MELLGPGEGMHSTECPSSY